MTPAVPIAARAAVGSVPDVHGRLALQRPRPLLVRLYAALLSEGGLAGRPARRRLRAFVLRSLPAAAATGGGALVVLGAFDGLALGWGQAAALLALVGTLAGTAARRVLRAGRGEPASRREQLELGALLVVAAYAVARTGASPTGDGESPFQPVVYLVMAFLVAFLARDVGIGLVAAGIGLELLVWAARGAAAWELPGTVVHSAFLALFALLYQAVLAARMASARHAEATAVERRLRDIAERARELRLLGPGGAGAEDREERERRWTEAAVVEVEAAVRGVLEIAEGALRTHTVAVFMLSPDDRELRLRECRSPSEAVTRAAIPAGEGALGGAVRRRAPVRLAGEQRSPSYYRDGTAPLALLAVPLVDGGHVRGVLVADRLEAAPFSDGDERLLLTLAAEVVRACAAERLMIDMKRARDEKVRFYEALERLNGVTKQVEVFDAVLEVAGALAAADFAAVTVVQEEDGRSVHRVARVRGADGQRFDELQGLEIPDGRGVAASVLRHGFALPARGLDPARQQLFGPDARVTGLSSLKVVPLRAAGRLLGTLALGTRRDDAFGDDVVRQLEVVAMQAAQSIYRAQLFDETERLATTDGLTGLVNHRTFQVRLDEQLAQARRYGKKLALILCDIDHFKSVNDTHGHPVGDVVLKGVARTLQKEARATDVVARYGGEEFAVVMPETDAAGAVVIAERIRERVKALVFDAGKGPLRVTLSLGIAAVPDDAAGKGDLVARADACLYHAKRSGRDRSVPASSLHAPAPARLGRAAAAVTSPEPAGP